MSSIKEIKISAVKLLLFTIDGARSTSARDNQSFGG
jgi:hypothetical protein